jgi:PAS domain S-box-containing protein
MFFEVILLWLLTEYCITYLTSLLLLCRLQTQNDHLRDSMAYSLAMASLEGNSFPQLTRQLNERERKQIKFSERQGRLMSSPTSLCYTSTHQPQPSFLSYAFPKTLRDALRPSSRAIVVTEANAPFRVVNVNKAWEDLCGYTYLESKGRSLGALLKGEETDGITVTAMINKLLHGEEAIAIVTNYTKEGRKFRNRIHVGPLVANDNECSPTVDNIGSKPSFFVGILREV